MEESVQKPLFTPTMILLILLVIILGMVAAAQVTGAVDLMSLMRKIPGVEKVLPAPGKTQGSSKTLDQVENEKLTKANAELQKRVDELEMTVANGNAEQANAKQLRVELERQVNDLKEQQRKVEAAKTDAQEWAKRLEGMKPKDMVKVLEQLPDEKVTQILNAFSRELSSKVLAGLPPERSARLLDSSIKEEQAKKAQDEQSKTNYQTLGKRFDALSPEEANTIMEGLPGDMAARLIKEMSQDKAAKALGAMAPDRAADLVKRMAAMK